MERWTLLMEVGVGLLFGALLTGSFLGINFKVLVLAFIGLCILILGVAYGKEEVDE